MPHDPDPTSPLSIFGDELRHARMSAGLSQDQLGAEVGYSEAQVGHVENGKRKPSVKFAEGCDRVFGTNGLFARICEKIDRMPAYPAWLGPWATAEREAISVHHYEPLIVPGLLQTQAYARAILRGGRPRDTDEQIEELVRARMDRQQILTWDEPPALWFVLDEIVLRRGMGDAELMREQLEHLVAMAGHPQVTVQVVPFGSGPRPGLLGAFGIATFQDRPDVVYLETAASGQIVSDPRTVALLDYTYDAIGSCALPAVQSIDLIRKAMTEPWI